MDNNKLYGVKELDQTYNIEKANDYLKLGWFLIHIQETYDKDTLYVFGWDKEESPDYPMPR